MVALDRKSVAFAAIEEACVSSSPKSLPVTMPVSALSHSPADSDWVCCLNCGEHLDQIQPETQLPERLVGSCDHCGRWYLLDWDPGSLKGLMVLLPSHEELMNGYESLRGDTAGH